MLLYRLVSGEYLVEIEVESEVENESEIPHVRNGHAVHKARVKAGRSEIAFPYLPLDEALSVPQAIHENGSVPCSRDQLAVAMKMAPGSGAFSLKLGAARMFGLVESQEGRYQITPLGDQAISSDEIAARTARVKAFYSVPLYKRTYEEFKGKALPPRPRGLENAFASFGVAPKQTDKARQAFERSAQFAGFFSGSSGTSTRSCCIVLTNFVYTSRTSSQSPFRNPSIRIRAIPTVSKNFG